MFTCGYRLSQSCNCEHSHLLLLSRAGNRLERSHSYKLLRYVLAKKKQMLWKFWKRGGGGLDLRVFLSNQFPCLNMAVLTSFTADGWKFCCCLWEKKEEDAFVTVTDQLFIRTDSSGKQYEPFWFWYYIGGADSQDRVHKPQLLKW